MPEISYNSLIRNLNIRPDSVDTSRIIKELSVINLEELTELTNDKESLFFDMDGTILNSEPLHFKTIEMLTKGQSPYTIDDLYGLSDTDVYPLIKDHLDHDLELFLKAKNDLMLEVIPKTDISLIFKEEMREVLQTLKKTKKIALVTASEEVITHALLNHCKLSEFFDIIITRQSVKQTKPAPDPYQLALKMLETDVLNSIVFEDSPTGIEAARIADIDTVKVTWYE
jgi:putative hydrolase of the HAD superfamily